MEDARCRLLNRQPVDDRGRYVLYWMQQSQRAVANHALEKAIVLADRHDRSLVVGFGLTDCYPEANARHYAFMLQGLAETDRRLSARGIKLIVRRGDPAEVALELARDAVLVVCDRGYLRHQRTWRRRLTHAAGKQVLQVEADVVVPVETASDRAETAARTIRSKLQQKRQTFLTLPAEKTPGKTSLYLPLTSELDPQRPARLLEKLDVDDSVVPVEGFEGGSDAARSRLRRFIVRHLPGYAESRNDPVAPQVSGLSPYLHFGQIGAVEVAAKVLAAKSGSAADKEAFLEELIVRRELAVNFVFYTKNYDKFGALPGWARKTLAEHRDDPRPYRYTRKQLEKGATHDRYWNAAMAEMRLSGYLPNYMRMYWGKKILEWCNTPEYAYATALYLNNKYFLDGRDPNSYANVAWLFGLHDRPWPERAVFGKVRYMNAAGLERKFDMAGYLRRVEELGGRAR